MLSSRAVIVSAGDGFVPGNAHRVPEGSSELQLLTNLPVSIEYDACKYHLKMKEVKVWRKGLICLMEPLLSGKCFRKEKLKSQRKNVPSVWPLLRDYKQSTFNANIV